MSGTRFGMAAIVATALAGCGKADRDTGAVPSETGRATPTGPETGADDDADDDGYPAADDCDDTDPTVHPGAPELCDDHDDDCDGEIDEDGRSAWYRDGDGDGHGDPTSEVFDCASPGEGWVASDDDCADTNAAVHPGAEERCNGLDDDCDGATDEEAVDATWHPDADGDGFGDPAVAWCDEAAGVPDASDCDDTDATVFPGAPEWCDGRQTDCARDPWSDDGTATFQGPSGPVDATADLTAGTPGNPAQITLAEDGTLSLCDGTYYANLYVEATSVRIEGIGGAAATVLSAGGTGNVVAVHTYGARLEVDGLTLTGGYGCYGSGIAGYELYLCDRAGGSASAVGTNALEIIVTDSVISGNDDQLAAIAITGTSSLVLDGTAVANNQTAGVNAHFSDVACRGSAKSDAGIWGNDGRGVYLYLYQDTHTITSDVCDFGVGKADNASDDVYIQSYAGTLSKDFGDDESFTCDGGSVTCL